MKDNETQVKRDKIIKVFIGLPTEDVCGMRDVNTTILVHQFKSKVELRVGIPGDLIHLFFMNKELLDDKPLEEYKLKHGCILRVRLHKTWVGLFWACYKGDSFEVFNNGVQKMTQDSDCSHSDLELWNKLVVKRASFALFMATHRGYLSLMLELLNSSAADVNGSTIFGRTSLHIAAFQGFVGCVSLLLSNGALSNAVDIFGKTALQLAHINKHIYCQKRLYLHQTAAREEEQNRGKVVDEAKNSPLPSVKQRGKPSKVILDSRQNGKVRNTETRNTAQRSTSGQGLPNISVNPQHHLTSPSHSTGSTSSYTLPEMQIIDEHARNYQNPNGSSSTYLELCTPALPTTPPKTDTTLPQNIPKGIEGILKTSQSDIVGEYHSIQDSIADVNVTTLKLVLPTWEETDEETSKDVKKDKLASSYGGRHGTAEVPRTQTPLHSKRILGFVLKAEENDENSVDEDRSEQPEIELLKSVELSKQEPEESKSIPFHRRVTSSLSYDEWLSKKRESAKPAKNARPRSASFVRTKVGREMSVEAFQNWLKDKKKVRRRRASADSLTVEKNRSGAGLSFEMWLSKKRQHGSSFPGNFELNDHTSEKSERPKTINLGGKTFSEWLSEKQKRSQQSDSTGNSEKSKTRSHLGKPFKQWLKDKRKEKRKDAEFQESMEIKKLQEKAFLEEQRRLNPRVKTFDEWFEEKRAQNLIEFVQSRNAPDEPTLLNCKVKFPEDAELVFDMWLTSKHMEELAKEQEKYEEMKEKWRKKEQERLQIRNGILHKLNQVKKER